MGGATEGKARRHGEGGVEMLSGRERRKAQLMKEAESVIDRLLDWTDETSEPDLGQIEAVVLELRQQFSEQMSREAIEAQEAKQPVSAPDCPKCGRAMRYKGQKEVEPRTWVGDVRFRRGYYYCEECGEGVFPPG